MSHPADGPLCEYVRTALAVGLWLHRADLVTARQLVDDCEDKPHLAADLGHLANGLLRAVSGCGDSGVMAACHG